MPMPFGGHPTFAQYLHWASRAGCKVHSGIAHGPNGSVETVTRIDAPNGRWVVAVGYDQRNFLLPTQIDYLDRRLQMKSPFFSINPGADL